MNHDKSVYAPPESTVADLTLQAADIIPAGKWRRFLNYLIDFAAMIVIFMVISVVWIMILGEESFDVIDTIPDFVFGSALTILYYLPFEWLTSRTPGKILTGTKVVDEQGFKPTFGQTLGRTFNRIIPFEAFSFLGETGRGWHDRWAKTYVIRVR